ncbi:cadmium-translocating P-type ATPase [Marinihelvus fidelis]|uniref:Cadmium-translocating P-type ATPase n=1 Tax=Marinihelvus fidelis TaxID=2613842 RepID=A0A5N0TC27_9GAMM|nr:heavy metal translocating P-type ATPase [Marinihelvus fidelis]KAA9132572.1 cadmium-translocating P-type ATPase [Marinihelvus fidelis]
MTDTQAACFHCGEACEDDRFQVRWEGESRCVCCAGCQAVFELIHASGHARYYRFREGEGIRAPDSPERLAADWAAIDARPAYRGTPMGDGFNTLLLQVEGVHCAACAWLIRSRLEPLDGVRRASVDIASGYTQVEFDPERTPPSRLALELARFGYRPHLPLAGEAARSRLDERRLAMRRLGVAGLGMMQVMMYAVGLYAGDALGIGETARRFLEWTSLVVTLPVVAYAGLPFFRGAVAALRARRPGMDLPVALAISIAFVASTVNFLRGAGDVYFDSVVMFIFFLSIARFVQMNQRHRNAQAGAALARLMPEWAERLDNGTETRVPAADLVPGDRVRVKPGRAFPADGVIIDGRTRVDEAILTGESRPVLRERGDEVAAGAVNREQSVIVEVRRTGDDTAISTLGRRMLSARAGQQRPGMADRLSGYFIVAVLGTAVAALLYWGATDPARALSAMLAVLVVSCPCALALATPAALSAASRSLLARGVLLARGEALESLARADTVVFDKTGTLTEGQPVLSRVHLNPDRATPSVDRVEAVAAALEVESAHPLARAFSRSTGEIVATAVDHAPGRGLSGYVEERRYRLGTAEFAGAPAGKSDDGAWLADEEGWLAQFGFSDRLREDAGATVEALARRGLAPRILSGDGIPAVRETAAVLGIEDWQARQAPEDKIRALEALRAEGRVVLMVGDGVNDAPVLAAADASMTVHGAAELAQGAADMALVGAGLDGVRVAHDTALRTRRVIRQNLAWALAYNLLAVPLAFSGWLQPWMAALGMSLSSLLVVGNAARLART